MPHSLRRRCRSRWSFGSCRKSLFSPALMVALALECDRVVALALDCLKENFAEDVSQGEVARLAGVDRYHRFASLITRGPAHRSRSSSSLWEARIA
jgi:hypothetical protein